MEKDSWVGVTYFYNWNYGANPNVCNSRIQNRSIDLLGNSCLCNWRRCWSKAHL